VVLSSHFFVATGRLAYWLQETYSIFMISEFRFLDLQRNFYNYIQPSSCFTRNFFMPNSQISQFFSSVYKAHNFKEFTSLK
jgi:hypothetical protein